MAMALEDKDYERKNREIPRKSILRPDAAEFYAFSVHACEDKPDRKPSVDGRAGIAGHMEWFDLIDETVRAFLIVPLYALLNRCMQDGEKFRERVFQTFVIANAVYLLFAVVTFRYCSSLVSAMVSERIYEVTGYLRLETVGFIIANVVSFVNVLFVVLEKPFYVYAMILLRTMATVVGDLLLIPGPGVNGVAYSNIAVNFICVVLCLFVVCRKKLFVVSFHLEKSFVRDYLRIGFFSGAQILYGLLAKGVFSPSLTFICMMFGFGMVVHLSCSIVCFILHGKRSGQMEKNRP